MFVVHQSKKPDAREVLIRQFNDAGELVRRFVSTAVHIDSGMHADIFAVNDNGRECVVKKPKTIVQKGTDLTPVQREIAFFKKKLQHENLISFLGFCRFNLTRNCILLPRAGRSLYDAINTSDALCSSLQHNFSSIVVQILTVLNFLHQRGIAHLDLKPENIMLKTQGEKICIQLIDFGMYADISCREGRARGSFVFAAPELFGLPFDQVNLCAADMWSAAVIFFVLIAGVCISTHVACQFVISGTSGYLSASDMFMKMEAMQQREKDQSISTFYDLLIKTDFLPIIKFYNMVLHYRGLTDAVRQRVCDLCLHFFTPQLKRFTAQQALNFLKSHSGENAVETPVEAFQSLSVS